MNKNSKIILIVSATGIAFSALFLTLTDSNSERSIDSSRLSESDPKLKSPNLVTPYTQDDRDRTLTQTGSPDRNSQSLNKMSDRAKIKAKEALHAIASTKQSQNFKKSIQQKAGSSDSLNSRHINYLKSQSAVGSLVIHPKKGPESYELKLVLDKTFTKTNIILKSRVNSRSGQSGSDQAVLASQFILNLDKDELSQAERDDLKAKLNLNDLKRIGPSQYLAVGDPSSAKAHVQLQEKISRSGLVNSMSENSVQYLNVIPNDPGIPVLRGLIDPDNDIDIDGEEAWNYNSDCSNLEIAVIDTGADPDHPDLIGSLSTEKARNFTSADPAAWADDNDHGSHVSGTIGATGNNQTGITGVCWNAKIIPLKALNAAGTGSDAGIIAAINWVTEQTNAKLINASFGSGFFNQTAKTAIENFCAKGGIFVAAAGNDNNNNNQIPAFPSNYDVNCIVSVAALDTNNELASFSNYGLAVDIAAPGTNIASTGFQGDYIYMSGTSMAAPHVTGMLGLAWHAKPDIINTDLINMLYQSSEKYGNTKPIQEARRANLKNFMELALDVDGKTKELWDRMFMTSISGEQTEEIKTKIRAGEIPWDSWEEHYLVSDLFNETANRVWSDTFSTAGTAPISDWQNLIRSGKSLQDIKKDLTESSEFESEYQKRMVRITGQKALTEESKEKWATAIQSGQSIEILEKEFLVSESLANHVTKLFQDLFKANPDPKVLEKIQKQLEDPEQSFAQVKQVYLDTPLTAITINQYFNELLHRNASSEEISAIRTFMKEDHQEESVREKISTMSP